MNKRVKEKGIPSVITLLFFPVFLLLAFISLLGRPTKPASHVQVSGGCGSHLLYERSAEVKHKQ